MKPLVIALVMLLAASAAAAQPFIYSVSNTGYCAPQQPCPGPRLLVTNVRTGAVVNGEDAELFPGADGVAGLPTVSPDGTRLYITMNPTPRQSAKPPAIIVIDTASLKQIGTIVLPYVVFDLLPSPDGALLYGSNPITGAIMVIDPAALRVARTVRADRAFAMAMSKDGGTLAVTATPLLSLPSSVMVYDTSTWTRRITITVPDYPQRIAMSHDSSRIYVSSYSATSGSIVTIDPVTGAVDSRGAGAWLPIRLLVNPDDTKVYVTFVRGGAWGVLTPDGTMTVHSADVPGGAKMVPSADWTHLYVAGTNGILDIDTATDTIAQTLAGASDLTMSSSTRCDFTLPQQDAVFGPGGGTGTITVPIPAGCEWGVQNTPDVSVVTMKSPTTGTGAATVAYSVAASSAPRTTTIRIAGQSVRVSVFVPWLFIDAPARGAVLHPPFVLSGWTLQQAIGASSGGIDIVHAWAFPVGAGKPVFLGAPTYGAARPDVGAAFGPAYGKTGFNFVVPWLSAGTYDIAVYGHSADLGFAATHAVRVAVVGDSHAMALDLPSGDLTVGSADAGIFVAGWAFDRAAAAGTGVDAIHVWAYPIGGGAAQFLGTAAYGFDRPDVGAFFGAGYRRSGFSAIVAKPLPGSYWLVVYARSTASGTFDQWRLIRLAVLP